MKLCEAHGSEPAEDYHDGPCYGKLWQCQGCNRMVCAGYGAADDLIDFCDSCWARVNPRVAHVR